MSKKILILNSSPRKGGNTDALTHALADGAASAGHRVRTLILRQLDMHHCLGCYLCRDGKGDPCVQKDDMNTVYEALEGCDTVVLAFPLYWWQMNSIMKVVIDRLCALAVTTGIPVRDCAMVVTAGDDKPDNCDEIVSYYQSCVLAKFGWQDRGVLLTEGIDMPGDAQKTDYMEQARQLGANL